MEGGVTPDKCPRCGSIAMRADGLDVAYVCQSLLVSGEFIQRWPCITRQRDALQARVDELTHWKYDALDVERETIADMKKQIEELQAKVEELENGQG